MRVTYIDWARVASDEFEDLVAAVMAEVFPDSQAIDGSGGDAGRDVQVRTSAGLHWYDAKCFAARLGHTQRRQIERSLHTALRRSPKRWTVVVALKPTDSELSWFEGLDHPRDVEIRLLDRIWLEAQLAKRQHLVRAYLRTFRDTMIEVAAEFSAEQALLTGGLPDALSRFEKLQALTDTVDPNFRFGVATRSDGGIDVTVNPRNKEAAGSLTAEFSVLREQMAKTAPSLAEQVKEVLDFGGSVEIPPEYISKAAINLPAGLGAQINSPGLASLKLSPTPEDEAFEANGWLQVETARGRRLDRLPIIFRGIARGRLGTKLEGRDSDGVLGLVIRIPFAGQSRATLEVGDIRERAPVEILPTLRFLNLVRSPHKVSIWINGSPLASTPAGEYAADGIAPSDDQVAALEALDLINQTFHLDLRLPDEVSKEDWDLVLAIGRLLRDGYSTLPIFVKRLPLSGETLANFVSNLGDDVGMIGLDMNLHIRIPFQPSTDHYLVCQARFIETLDESTWSLSRLRSELEHALASGLTIEVPLRPVDSAANVATRPGDPVS